MKSEQPSQENQEKPSVQHAKRNERGEGSWVRVTENREMRTFQAVFVMEFAGVVRDNRNGRN